MNALLSFFKSKDGLVAIATIILLGVVSAYGTPYNPWINFLARVGNILVFLYILWRVAGKSLVSAMAGRRAAIAAELDGLALRKREAEERLRDLEQRLSGLEAEREAILEESRRQARALRETLIAEAQEDAKRIREQALRAADSEAKSARDELRARLADEIVLAVEEVLKTRLAGAEAAGDGEEAPGKKPGGVNHAKLIDNALKRVVLH